VIHKGFIQLSLRQVRSVQLAHRGEKDDRVSYWLQPKKYNRIEGRTVAIEYRWAEGRNERYADIATEFVRLKVDVIVTVGSAVAATKQVTSTIPIVFAIAVDPLGSGMVESLARPGGNATGLSAQST
jgi:ABC-type uncharacterized transport system substrate-binding protein